MYTFFYFRFSCFYCFVVGCTQWSRRFYNQACMLVPWWWCGVLDVCWYYLFDLAGKLKGQIQKRRTADHYCIRTHLLSFFFKINLVIFVLALRSALSSSDVSTARTLRSTTKDSTGTTQSAAGTTLRKAKVALKGSTILLPILGLTWLFGLLVFNRDTIVFKYLFAICNSLQGIMIFLFHVVINKKVSIILGTGNYIFPYVCAWTFKIRNKP